MYVKQTHKLLKSEAAFLNAEELVEPELKVRSGVPCSILFINECIFILCSPAL